MFHSTAAERTAKPPELVIDADCAEWSDQAGKPLPSRLAVLFRAAYEHLVFYGLIAIFGLVCLFWSVPASLLHHILPCRLGEPLGQRAIMIGFRGFVAAMRATGLIRCDLAALDALRAKGAVVIAPNHPSLLDAVLVMSRLPGVVCAAKAEIWDNIFLGGGARLAGFIRNNSPAKLVMGAVRQLKAGRQFLIFPEGTRSNAVPVGKFKGGFALIAKRAGTPVQAVFIESNSRFLGKGWALFKKPDFPLVYRVRLGESFSAAGDLHDFVARLHSCFDRELGADRSP